MMKIIVIAMLVIVIVCVIIGQVQLRQKRKKLMNMLKDRERQLIVEMMQESEIQFAKGGGLDAGCKNTQYKEI